MTARVERIRQRLDQTLAPVLLEISDDSHLHVGHAGAAGGGGHFTVTVVSNAFVGKSLIERHRMIYDALADDMSREIHALSIKAKTVAEAAS